MEANQTPTQTEQLITSLFTIFHNHINTLVEQRVNQIFEAHATVKQLDEQWEERIKGYVAEAIEEHEGDYDHPTNDDISDKIASHVAHIDFTDNIERAVEQILRDNDYVTEDRVTEMIDEADIEDQVKEVLRNI